MQDFRPPTRFSGLMAKLYAAAFVLFVIALGARIVFWLIAPFFWMLITIVVLGAIYIVIVKGFRR